jgi:hypothetical protein
VTENGSMAWVVAKRGEDDGSGDGARFEMPSFPNSSNNTPCFSVSLTRTALNNFVVLPISHLFYCIHNGMHDRRKSILSHIHNHFSPFSPDGKMAGLVWTLKERGTQRRDNKICRPISSLNLSNPGIALRSPLALK